MKATIYYEDGRIETVTPENGSDFKLEQLQSIVNGMIQIVPLDDRLLVCNEEGKINGKCGPNINATMEWLKVYGQTDVMYGNILICDETMIK
jgi:hypothetical protein